MILPIYAASSGSRTRSWRRRATSARTAGRPSAAVVLPLALPGIVAGSIFTFSLTLGDYITPLLVGGTSANFIGNVIYDELRHREQPPVRRGAGDGAGRDHGRLPARRPAPRRVGGAVDGAGVGRRVGLRIWVGAACSRSCSSRSRSSCCTRSTARTIESWPIRGYTLHWFSVALARPSRSAPRSSCRSRSGCVATLDRAGPRHRWPPSPSTASRSSAATRSRSCWCCRSRCPASSPASR